MDPTFDPRRFMTPRVRSLIVETLRERAEYLRKKAQIQGKGASPNLWLDVRDLENAARDLEDYSPV